MTYREEIIQVIKIACQDLIDNSEKLIPVINGLYSVDLVMHIPTLSDKSECIPEIAINIGSYPSRAACNKIIELVDKT